MCTHAHVLHIAIIIITITVTITTISTTTATMVLTFFHSIFWQRVRRSSREIPDSMGCYSYTALKPQL